MNTLYAAVGRFECQNNNGHCYPVILVKSEENIVDIHEMILWTCLNWQFLSLSQMKSVYEQKVQEVNTPISRSFEQCLNRLLQRDLIASGTGDTGADALYDLLNSLYIIPTCSDLFTKILSFLKLTFYNRLSFSVTKRLFQTEPMTTNEQRVIGIAKQALLSTAEIIKCIEKDVYDLSTNQKVLEILYNDEYTTCDNIGSLAKYLKSRQPIIQAVANLYLHKQIILERV